RKPGGGEIPSAGEIRKDLPKRLDGPGPPELPTLELGEEPVHGVFSRSLCHGRLVDTKRRRIGQETRDELARIGFASTEASLGARFATILGVALALLGLPLVCAAQDLASFENRITTKKLDNGLTAIVCERPVAPVFSFFTHVDAGASQEEVGQTGLAHMFEHMAFKGTDKIGTTDYAAEKVALERLERTFAEYEAARRKTVGHDEKEVAEQARIFNAAVAEADKYVVKNEFAEIVEREGGVGLSAFTNAD